MKKVYVFPAPNRNSVSRNPYIGNLLQSFIDEGDETNTLNALRFGPVVDMFKAVSCDILIINWPENIGERKCSVLQGAIYLSILLLCALKGVRLVWILHNKQAHKGNTIVGRVCTFVTQKAALLVATHCNDGILYYREKYRKNNIFCFPIPIYEVPSFDEPVESCDILIWGLLERYKGVLEFLNYVKKERILRGRSIAIYGLCQDKTYLDEIENVVKDMENVFYYNVHLDDKSLCRIIASSKVVIFTYNSPSTLSSASLVYTIPFKKKIIAPNVGSFKDLGELGLVSLYDQFSEIERLVDEEIDNVEEVERYMEAYTWKKFAQQLCKALEV